MTDIVAPTPIVDFPHPLPNVVDPAFRQQALTWVNHLTNVKVGELNAFTANINNNAQAAHERAATAQEQAALASASAVDAANSAASAWQAVDTPGRQGDPGPKGDPGQGISLSGSVAVYGDLPTGLGAADAGKGYLVQADGRLYVWDGAAFPANGAGAAFTGPQGPQGPQGDAGPQGIQGPQGEQGPAGSGSGDVLGPASSVDGTPVVFDGSTGKYIKAGTKQLSTEDYTTAEKSKLAGVATGATANATDAALRDRATHTGTQAIGTVTGLQAALDGKLDTAGNAATATKLATARTIGGVSFDGSANINLPGVNAAGTQNTTGSAAKWTTERTLTLGATGKSVDGSGNVTWTLAEMGAAADSAVLKLTGAQTAAGVKTFSDRSSHAGAYTPAAQPTHSATPTFDCAVSNVFEPAAMTGNVTSITLSNPVAGQTVQIRFQQDATGGRTCAVPSGAKVDGSINTGANRVSWLIMTYSSRGSRWEGNFLQVPV